MEPISDSSRLSSTSASLEVGSHGTEQTNPRSSPKHPIPQLQGAFEESIHEASQEGVSNWIVDLDAQSRRRDLLENDQYERLCGRKWRQRVDERYHPFWKLVAQISFGLHLLVQRKAKSNAAVLKILQTHVNEIDGFVSRTTEDLLIIQIDLRTRIQYLSLPLENLDDFDAMLMDRNFRLAMIDYNGKVELAIQRFTMANNDALKDLQKGREAIGGLWQFLGQSAEDNAPLSDNLTAIYNSMLANTEGWNSAFFKLGQKATALQYAIRQLNKAIFEMQRRVGVASRKDVMSFIQPSRPVTRAKSIKSFFERGTSIYRPSTPTIDKPLPSDPSSSCKSNERPRTSVGRANMLAHQKSVPNLRTAAALNHCPANVQTPDRAKSVSGAPLEGSESRSVLPRFSRTISRRLSRAKLSKVISDEVSEGLPVRPSTSASRTMKSFRKSRYDHQPHTKQPEAVPEPLFPTKVKRPGTTNAFAKGEATKEQLLQYFKSDRVIDVWEGLGHREKNTSQNVWKKDGLWSRFQARSSNTRPGGLSKDPLQEDIQRQMAWLDEEARNLNIYSLKSRPKAAPRFHTISEHLSFQQHPEYKESQHHSGGLSADLDDDKFEDDDESIITALPSFPLPPVSIPSSGPPQLLTQM